MKKIIWILLTCVPLMLGVSPASAQDGTLIAEMTAGNFFGIGARAMGMGGAQTASVLDGTALIYNPAALSSIRRIELLISMSHQKLDNKTDPRLYGTPISGFNSRSQNNTRPNGVNLSVPVPTYRGGLVVAFGLNRVRSFDRTFKIGYRPEAGSSVYGSEAETGSMYALSGGAAIDLSPKISVGGSLNYYFGTDTYLWRLQSSNSSAAPLVSLSSLAYTEYNDRIEDHYSGYSAKAGIMFAPYHLLKMGVTIETPIRYTIKEDYLLRTSDVENGTPTAEAGEYEYDLLTPFSLGAGLAFDLNYLQLSADINYSDWTQMEYKGDLAMEEDNIFIQDNYRDVLRASIGAEYLIPQIGIKLRAGFMSDPLPYTGEKILNDRKFYTFGIGCLIDRVVTLDVALAIGGYKIQGKDTGIIEDYDLDRLYVTTGFRL